MKKKDRGPRRQRMTRDSRLQHVRATDWVKKYDGKNIVRAYSRWFGVDGLCAIFELRALGQQIDEEYEDQVRASIEATAAANQRKKAARERLECRQDCQDADAMFCYTAGHTSGGAPYGVTWEELGERVPWLSDDDERGGAGQGVTRQESNREGREESQPKSEGHAR